MKVTKIAIIGDTHLKLTNPRCRKDNYFNSLLAKLEYIIQENDMVICLGDLFDKASVEEQCKNMFMQLLIVYSHKPFYTIFGNHDLFKYNTESIDETSLGICFIKNLVRKLDKIEVNGYTFQEIPFVKRNPIMPVVDNNTILLGHFFYESEISPNYSIYYNDIAANNAKYIFLGHDHTPYDPISINDTILFRPGSTCRNTANDYNIRIPNYIQLTFDDNNNITPALKPILVAKSPEDIFVKDLKVKIKNKSKQLDVNLNTITFTKLVNIKLANVLNNMNTPNKCVDYITNLHQQLNYSM